MSKLFQYRHSGLKVASEIELPEWEAFAVEFDNADVRFRLSDKPCPDCPFDGSVLDGGTLRFAIEGIGGWQIRGGREIILHPGLTTAPPELRLFTLGSAWGALGYQRGFAMWHGSAVERGGEAILFCGEAGAGKSTLAAMLTADGARLVADDLSRVQPGKGGAKIYPSSSRIKLWYQAIDFLGWQERVIQRDYYRDEKFHCSAPNHCGGQAPLHLAGIVILEEASEFMIRPLTGHDAFEAVMSGTLYRPEMIDLLKLWPSQGAAVASIISGTQVWKVSRPKKFELTEQFVEAISGFWAEPRS